MRSAKKQPERGSRTGTLRVLAKSPLSRKAFWVSYAVLAGIALLVRVAFALKNNIVLQGDAGHYYYLAHNLIHGGYYGVTATPDSLRPPGYPFILALVASVFTGGVVNETAFMLINGASDAVSMFLLMILGKRLGLTSALPGILLVALSPFWFGNINSAVTEPISITLFLAFLERWSRSVPTGRDLFWGGFYLSILSVTRSMFSFFAIAVILFHWGLPRVIRFLKNLRSSPRNAPTKSLRAPEGVLKLNFKLVAIFMGASYIFPVIWGVRSWVTMGEFAMTNPTISTTMIWTATKIPLLDYREPELSAAYFNLPLIQQIERSKDKVEIARLFTQMKHEAIQFIMSHPMQFAYNVWIKFCRLWVTGWWNPYSYLDSPRQFGPLYVWVFCVPVLLLGLFGVGAYWLERSKKKNPGIQDDVELRISGMQLLLILYTSIITAPTLVDSRYSLTAYILFGLWLGYGWKKLVRTEF